MVSEFRALRASVVRLWTKQLREVGVTQIAELTRFHEAIDQLIAESVTRYSEEIKQSKDRFLAILGHDLRSPLSAIITSSAFLLETGALKDSSLELVRAIASSAGRMNQMVKDLLDFARTRFGDRIPIVREETDLKTVVEEVVSEVAASSPHSSLEIEINGDLRGRWDANRLAQVLTNLVTNAVEHGAPNAPIEVSARGEPRDVVLSVHSSGPPIPQSDLRQIFDAAKSGSQDGDGLGDGRHLGLGLYIVDKIVAAHGGSVDVRSSTEKGTTFTVHLPRNG
jgi:signal transduction histidine kinase